MDLGADVIVAQGAEAGGHSGRGWSTMAFVPVVADLAAPVPVLAAGGIADGRGLAAALALGATGALVGTRFLATAESLADSAANGDLPPAADLVAGLVAQAEDALARAATRQ